MEGGPSFCKNLLQPSKSPFNSPFFKGGLRGIQKEGEQEGKEGRWTLLSGGEREVIEKK